MRVEMIGGVHGEVVMELQPPEPVRIPMPTGQAFVLIASQSLHWFSLLSSLSPLAHSQLQAAMHPELGMLLSEKVSDTAEQDPGTAASQHKLLPTKKHHADASYQTTVSATVSRCVYQPANHIYMSSII